MKKLLLSLLLIGQVAYAQTGGQRDGSFGDLGKVISSINPTGNIARSIAQLSDGSYLVAGETYSAVSGKDFFCIKLLVDGSPDLSFGTNGVVTTDLQLGSSDVAHCLVVKSNGNFVVVGSSDNGNKQYAAMVGYNADGSLDNTFGNNGIVLESLITSNDDTYRKVVIHALTGKLIVVGNSAASSSVAKPVIARYSADGVLDATFNGNGKNLFPSLTSSFYVLNDVHVEPTGRITAVGDYGYGNNFDNGWFVRLSTNGTLDQSFSSDGHAGMNYMSHNNAMHLDPINDYVYVAGSVYAYFGQNSRNERMTIKRVEENGIGSSWASAGQNSDHYTTPAGNEYFAADFARTPAGDFIVAGTGHSNTQKTLTLMKLDSEADRDLSFGSPTTAQVVETFDGDFTEPFDMLLQDDGKFMVVGYVDNEYFVARYFGTTVAQLSSFNLVYPPNNSTELVCVDVNFDWSNAVGAQEYEIQLSTSSSFSSYDSQVTYLSELSALAFDPVTATSYYWRVRAMNSDSTGAWQGPWKFTTTLDDIELYLPADGATQVNPLSTAFDWSNLIPSVNYNQSFDFQISTNPSFTGAPIVGSLSSNQSNYTYPTDLDINTTYYWRVRTDRGFNIKGPWSDVSEFTTGNPSGLNDHESTSFIVSPNPVTNQLNIQFANPIQNSTDITVINALGELVVSQTVAARMSNISVDVSELSGGLYFVCLGNEILGEKRKVLVVRD